MDHDEREEAMRKEIDRLRSVVRELDGQLQNGRHYLMSVQPINLTVESALEAFGFGRDGMTIY